MSNIYIYSELEIDSSVAHVSNCTIDALFNSILRTHGQFGYNCIRMVLFM